MASDSDAAPDAEIDRAERAFRRATALHRGGRLDEAAAAYGEVLRLNPAHKECYNNLGVALRAQGKFAAAVAAYCRAIVLAPNDAGTHSNLGNALRALGRLDDAEACHRRAIRLDPAYTEAHYNLGIALKDQGRIDEALACFDEVLKRNPDHAEAHWDRALARLVAGDFARGWPEYEWRWRLADNPARDLEAPLWTGEPLDGRTILLHAEQGLGDSIQFVRYAPLVAARGGRVLLECQAPLVRLFEGVAGVSGVVERGRPRPAFDRHAPLLGLPRILGTTMDSIPADIPYLAAESARAERIEGALAGFADGLKVGLVWAGKPSHKNDRNRSIGFEPLIGLLGLKGVFFFGLQVGPRAEDARAAGCDGLVHDLTGGVKDFADSAAVLEALDLLITVDTAPAHLAGALGRPAWVLIPFVPDWRWLLGRDDSPWYPSLRLFRQQRPGDWTAPLHQVAAALKQAVARRASGAPGR